MTTSCAPTTRLRHRLRGAILAGAALTVVASLALGAGVRGHPTAPAAAPEPEPERLLPIATIRASLPSLEALSGTADAVIVGRVVAQGETTFLRGSGGPPRPIAPAPADAAVRDKLAEARPAAASLPVDPAAERGEIPVYPPGLPMTRFTIEVSRVLRGGATGLASGARLTLVQAGGPVELPAAPDAPRRILPLELEDDPLFKVGERQLLFLSRQPNGEYMVAGGPDGRFALDAADRLRPMDDHSPIGRAQQGRTVAELDGSLRQLGR
jgi:hypothetical protein